MKRLNETNINTPELTNEEFKTYIKETGQYLQYSDIERFLLMTKDFKGGRLLDIGCYLSPLANTIKSHFPEAEVYAIDHADYLIKTLKEKYPEVNYICGDCRTLPFEDKFFDYITAGEIIEHLESPADFIKECRRVLKDKGVLVLSTPLEEGISQRGVGGAKHLWGFTKEDIENLLKPYGEVKFDEVIDYAETIQDKVKTLVAFLYV